MTNHSLCWIQASAGTGKTFTIVQEVLRLVHTVSSISQIVVVTFTRKATLELKRRIHQELKQALKEACQNDRDSAQTSRLEKALQEFPLLTIKTIHGFCSTILTSYPLESGLPFEPKTVSLTQQRRQRIAWLLRHWITRLQPEDLQKAGWEQPESLIESLEKALAEKWFDFEPLASCQALFNAWQKLKLTLNDQQSDLVIAYQKVKTIALTLPQDWQDFFSPHLDAVHQSWIKGPYNLLIHCGKLNVFEGILKMMDEENLKSLCKWLPVDHFLSQGTSFYRKKANISHLDFLKTVIHRLEDFLVLLEQHYAPFRPFSGAELRLKMTRYQILKTLVESFHHPQDDDLWQEGDELTYERMIKLTHHLVCVQKTLVQPLKARWTAALIDEFQDTDKLQWEIFRTLFSSGNLILVGDPKQSIYGFRGADLCTYTQAKDWVKEKKGRFLLLHDNYRSTAGLIEACNRLFSPFFPQFIPSRKAKNTVVGIKKQDKELSPFCLLVIEENIQSLSSLRMEIFRQSVVEILRLLEQADNVEPDDVLILTERNADSALILQMLTEKGIPAIAISDQGVFQSPQAQDLVLFLQALEHPRSASRAKALLLTPFFTHNPYQIEEALYLLQSALIQAQEHRQKGAFLEAFLCVFSCLEENPLVHLLSQENAERAYTNIFHLLQLLQDACQKEQFLASYAAAWFETQIEESAQEEVDLRLDRDSAAVRVMTIHRSKGLEAKIVFFCAGLKQPKTKVQVPFLVEGHVDFLGTPNAVNALRIHEWEESLRLFYVAFTRACSRFYAFIPKEWEANSLFAKTLWGRFFAQSQNHLHHPWNDLQLTEIRNVPPLPVGKDFPSWQKKRLQQRNSSTLELKTLCLSPFKRYLHVSSHTGLTRQKEDLTPLEVNSSFHEELMEFHKENSHFHDIEKKLNDVREEFHEENSNFPNIGEEFPKENSKFPQENPKFHDVGKKFHKENSEFHVDFSFSRDARQYFSYLDEKNPSSQEIHDDDELPSGALFGNLVHHLLQNLDFRAFSHDAPPNLVACQKQSFENHLDNEKGTSLGRFFSSFQRKEKLWNLLQDALNLDLGLPYAPGFCLSQLSWEKTRREVEFHVRLSFENEKILRWKGLWPEEQTGGERVLKIPPGYLTGWIDLLFVFEKRLYVVDWKTNRLDQGLSTTYVMSRSWYDLQALLYWNAVRCFSLQEDVELGGMIYLFLRSEHPQVVFLDPQKLNAQKDFTVLFPCEKHDV